MTIPQSWRHERHLLSTDQESPQRRPLGRRLGLGLFIASFALVGFAQVQAATLDIDSAYWKSSERRLRAEGSAPAKVKVKLVNAYNPSQVLGYDEAEDDGDWSIKRDRPSPVPCSVRAITPDGKYVDRAVSNAPSTCYPKAPTPTNQAPTAKANGPYSGAPGTAIAFSSAGSTDPDGTISAYAWTFGDGSTSTAENPSHTYDAAGSYTVTLKVTDDAGADSATSSTTATITAGVACNSPIQEHCNITAYTGPEVCVACHKGEARDMHGSVHYQQGGAFPNVTNVPSHFTAAGERPAKAAGEVATGINTYCGTHENSPRFTCAGCHVGNGRFPMAQSLFETLVPDSSAENTQLANIDCLMCHQEVYKRFPDWTTPESGSGQGFKEFSLLNLKVDDTTGKLVRSDGMEVIRSGFLGIPNVHAVTLDFQFKPAGSETDALIPMTLMPITTLAAAQTVHATTRQSCLNCHAGAAGADGAKRGDLSKENINPSLTLDMHMSPAGENLTCSDCHNADDADGANGKTHRVRGRGLDLRANDVPGRFTCDSGGCHTSTPHGDYSPTTGSSKDKHAMKVACQTCHIPSYAKAAVGTEVARDWQDPHPSDSACNGRGGWLPREDKGGLGTASLVPSYTWFDGTSEVMYLGESLLTDVPMVPLDKNLAPNFYRGLNPLQEAYALGMPNGDVNTSTAKIYPMKQHWGKLARDDVKQTLIGHSTFEFFRTGSFCRAVAVGLKLDEPNTPTSSVCKGTPGDLEMPLGTTTVPVFTYQTINHGVEPKDNALGGDVAGCGSCHQGLAPTGTKARLNTGSLGYGLRRASSAVDITNTTPLNGNLDKICSQCHSNETSAQDRAFAEVHKQHVSDKKKDCAACHNFSRPERSLSLSKN